MRDQSSEVIEVLLAEREQLIRSLNQKRQEIEQIQRLVNQYETHLQSLDDVIGLLKKRELQDQVLGSHIFIPENNPTPNERVQDFQGKSYPEMIRILADEFGGRFKITDVVHEIKDRGGAKQSKDLYNTITTQLKRMTTEFHRIGPGEWEQIVRNPRNEGVGRTDG